MGHVMYREAPAQLQHAIHLHMDFLFGGYIEIRVQPSVWTTQPCLLHHV
jgi:hypothetical protein